MPVYLPAQGQPWNQLPEHARYRIQYYDGTTKGWSFTSHIVFTQEEAHAAFADFGSAGMYRCVKISWADPWVLHSVVWVRGIK